MTDDEQIGAVIDEMYASISGPAGPRDWSRQANCFLPEARQVRTWVDEDGRPAMLAMSLDDYAANTTPFFAKNPFYEIDQRRGQSGMRRHGQDMLREEGVGRAYSPPRSKRTTPQGAHLPGIMTVWVALAGAGERW